MTIQAAIDQQMCPGCGGEVHPSGWADFRAGRIPCDGRLVGNPAPICGYRFPTRWRNKEDRQVVTEQLDGTGVTDTGAAVSAENMRLVRSGVFWAPLDGATPDRCPSCGFYGPPPSEHDCPGSTDAA